MSNGFGIQEAWDNVKKYTNRYNCSDDELILFEESLKFLYETDSIDRQTHAYNLASFYYSCEKYELAAKYFELADIPLAYDKLAEIWYYGLCGTVDYKKVFIYSDKSMYPYLLADMFRYGQYVNKNERLYREIINDLCMSIYDNNNCRSPIPEIFLREAAILLESEEDSDHLNAMHLIQQGIKFIKERIAISKAKHTNEIDVKLLLDMQKMQVEKAQRHFIYDDLLDIYYIVNFTVTNRIQFRLDNTDIIIEIVDEPDGSKSVLFHNKWFRDVRDFMDLVTIGGVPIRARYNEVRFISKY